MSRTSWAVVLLLAVAGSMPLHAQKLTEQQFLEDALASHPGIAAAEAEVDAASGIRRQAGVLDNPEITWEREDPDIAPRQDTWRLSWRLPFAEREAVLQANLDRTRRLAGWLRARAEEGEAAGVEAGRLDLEVEVLERESAAARAEALARRAAAAAWSSLITGEVQPDRPLLPPPPDTADVGDRPDLEALAHRAAEAVSRHQVQRRVLEPPEISVGWLEIRDGLQSFDGPVLGVAWPLPVFDRNQGDRQAAAAEVEKARSELEVARRRAVQHAQAALASYSDLYRSAAPTGVSAAEADVADAVLAAFVAGEASLTDVLDSLRVTVDVQMARLETLARALAAERELESAVGQPVLPGGSS